MPPDEPQQQITADPAAIPAETRPEWLPEQFKSPEDLARSYDEMRRETDRVREEAKKDREGFANAIAAMEAQQTQQQPYNPSNDPLINRWAEALAEGDAQTAFAIQLAVNQQQNEEYVNKKLQEFQPAITAQEQVQRDTAFTLAQERMERTYGDRWQELQPQVFALLNENQNLMPQVPSVEGYVMAMTERANVIEANRIVSERAAEERDRAAKLAAQGLTGTTSRGGPPTDAAKAAWKEVQDAPTSSFADLMNRAGR